MRVLPRVLSACRGMIAAMALMLAGVGAARGEIVTLVADPWCPYNCEPGSARPGFMVEIAREALALSGHEVEYEALNWMRSLQRVREGTAHGVIGAVPEEAPDFVFGPKLGTYLDTVAVRRGEMLDITAPGALEGKVVGAINGYEYAGPIADYVDEHGDDRSKVQFVSGDDPLAQNLRKLIAGRIDLVAEVELVLLNKIAEMGLQDQIEVVRTDDAEGIFIAFSPALEVSPKLARELEAGVETLRRSGRLAEIMAGYGLEDWN